MERRAQEVGVRETAGWGPGGHSQCGLEGPEEEEICCWLAGKSLCGVGGWVSGTTAPALPSSPSLSCPRGMWLTQGICLVFGGHEVWGHLWLLPSTARLYFFLLCG